MKITFLGHAGLFLETPMGSVLCDPWFTPAYFASWFPFPSNEQVEKARFGRPTYLFVSHLHADHFDIAFLRDYVWKKAVVLLPVYPLPLLERALRDLGFTTFVHLRHGERIGHQGLYFMALTTVTPADGPLGDSGLIIDDGVTCIYHQNDSRPRDLTLLQQLGPIHAHFVQYSGAIWYPLVYDYSPTMMQALGRKKRENEMQRALHYIKMVKASTVFPSAGPPCFLDDTLFAYNDLNHDPSNIFPDQSVFLPYLRDQGIQTAHLLIPGSTLTLAGASCKIDRPCSVEQIQQMFQDKHAYLRAYQRRHRQTLENAIPSYDVPHDFLPPLKDWFEPLLKDAHALCAGVNGSLLLVCEEQKLLIDFDRREVNTWDEEQEWAYRFDIDPALVWYCIEHHVEDWVNALFLSFRFKAQRKGPYNEYVYAFFKSLSAERMQYVEYYYASQQQNVETIEREGYRIGRFCPHAGADLSYFGTIENGILTCSLHGWQFALNEWGRCLNAPSIRLSVQQVQPWADPVATQQQIRCGQCWFHPVNE